MVRRPTEIMYYLLHMYHEFLTCILNYDHCDRGLYCEVFLNRCV